MMKFIWKRAAVLFFVGPMLGVALPSIAADIAASDTLNVEQKKKVGDELKAVQDILGKCEDKACMAAIQAKLKSLHDIFMCVGGGEHGGGSTCGGGNGTPPGTGNTGGSTGGVDNNNNSGNNGGSGSSGDSGTRKDSGGR